MESISQKILSIIPPLDPNKSKGENGRIGVIGGSYQFTGAPYYAAIAALKGGADLAHIFCPKCVATAIRSYTPQFIVHPVFTMSEQIEENLSQDKIQKMYQDWIQKIFKWQKSITSWIIGPGLGRDVLIQQFFPILIKRFKPKTNIVLDADGIYFLGKHPQLLQHLGTLNVILTPNKNEFKNINTHLKITLPDLKQFENETEGQIIKISNFQHKYPFGIVVKDRFDMYLNSDCNVICTSSGSNKRCGGMGDVLAGLVSTFSIWDFVYGPILAILVCREASKSAFQKQKRALTAPSVLEQVKEAFEKIEDKLNQVKKSK